MRVLLGISGASGAVYGVRTGAALLSRGVDLHLLVTATAWTLLDAELPSGAAVAPGARPPASSAPGTAIPAARDPLAGAKERIARLMSVPPDSFSLHAEEDYGIPFTSGSNPPDAMIIAPCSMGMLGRIAHGVSNSVLARCADVALKEKKPLVLVPRETPLSAIHLENMLTLARAGADILPACPGFYHRPATVGDLVDFVVSRILARVGIDAGLLPKWGEGSP